LAFFLLLPANDSRHSHFSRSVVTAPAESKCECGHFRAPGFPGSVGADSHAKTKDDLAIESPQNRGVIVEQTKTNDEHILNSGHLAWRNADKLAPSVVGHECHE